MTTMDPSVRTTDARASSATTTTPELPANPTESSDSGQPGLGGERAASSDRIERVAIPTLNAGPPVNRGLDARANDRALVQEVLARLETDTGELDDTRASIEHAAKQREALAARRLELALELENRVAGTFQSGSGVRLLDSSERNTLEPPAFGDVFMTEGDYRIDYRGHETRIYEKDENGDWKLNTRIWGDPHVDEKGTGDGDDWHFGEDSTFILPDGTKISLNTQETEPGNGVYFTVGIDIQSGDQRAYAGRSFEGEERQAGIANDRVEFDQKYADTRGTSGGVFALIGDQWAKFGREGFRDVETESWQGYLDTRNALGAGEVLQVTEQQALAVSWLAPGGAAATEAAPEPRTRAPSVTRAAGTGATPGEASVMAGIAELKAELERVDQGLRRSSQDLATLVRTAQLEQQPERQVDELVSETLEQTREAAPRVEPGEVVGDTATPRVGRASAPSGPGGG